MTAVRPDDVGYFPPLHTPFSGDVALGNVTQWRMQLLRTSQYGIALHVIHYGLAVFGPAAVGPAEVGEAFPDMFPGDRMNVADFINDQLSLRTVHPRFGFYRRDLASTQPDGDCP